MNITDTQLLNKLQSFFTTTYPQGKNFEYTVSPDGNYLFITSMVYGGQKILVDDLKKLESLIGATYDDMIVCLDRYFLMFRMNNLQTLPAK
ncbi:MAG: hypothetical protein K1X33_06540 [Methanobacteriaceae archaeon]|mgnify:FL=1|nr:hypothetical protein [Methanobacteriaceae archaeon]